MKKQEPEPRPATPCTPDCWKRTAVCHAKCLYYKKFREDLAAWKAGQVQPDQTDRYAQPFWRKKDRKTTQIIRRRKGE